jgi:hypothetical protein
MNLNTKSLPWVGRPIKNAPSTREKEGTKREDPSTSQKSKTLKWVNKGPKERKHVQELQKVGIGDFGDEYFFCS